MQKLVLLLTGFMKMVMKKEEDDDEEKEKEEERRKRYGESKFWQIEDGGWCWVGIYVVHFNRNKLLKASPINQPK